jgi:hypothetical protein
MAATTYPDNGDLQTYLTEIGITATISTETKDNALAEAVEWAEGYTGRVFISSHTGETRKYDVGGPQNGYVICEIQEAHSISSVSIGTGSALTLNTDYERLPVNPRSGWPYEAIRFLGATPYGTRSVNITGQFGWAAVPGAVKQAVMQYAAGSIVAAIDSGNGGPAQSRKIGDREVQYATSIVSNQYGVGAGSQLKKQAAIALAPFVRVSYV